MRPAKINRLGATILTLALGALPSFAQINYNFDDNQVPAGTTVNGVAYVTNGALHLTDAGQASINGGFVIPDPAGGKRVGNLHVQWKSLIGGGGGGGADGYSFNWGTDLAASGVGEEGSGTGLSVTVDTFDNGGGETGIEIKWGSPEHGSAVGAARTALLFIPKDDPGNGIYLRKNQFVDADLRVDNNTCTVTFTYDGQVLSTQLVNYAGIAGGNFSFGARTGGANDNQWIDDVRIDAGITEIVVTPIFRPEGTVWAYNDTTLSPGLHGTTWNQPGYDTNSVPGWLSGPALFGNDSAGIYDAAGQPFVGRGQGGFETPWDRSNARVTFYAITKFNWSGPTAGVTLIASNWVDDSLVAYLNGEEVSRIRLPDAPTAITWDTLGSNPGTEGLVEVRSWNASSLRQGENTVAVEVHQSGTASSDVAFALGLTAQLPLAPVITNCDQPTNRVVFANRSTTLQVFAIGSPAPTYQWYKDGSPIDPLLNETATSSSLVITQMLASDEGNYFARISNAAGTADSRTAFVDYVNDVNPPVFLRAAGSPTFFTISLEFDEAIDPSTATDPFNYSIDGGLTITNAIVTTGSRSVLLITENPQTPDTLYTVTILQGIRDLAGNDLAGNSTAQFRSWVAGCAGVIFETYNTGAGTSLANLTNHATFPNSPDFRTVLPGFDIRTATVPGPGDPNNPTFYNTDARENYGGRLRGWFVAPESGPHTFYFASDDNGAFWLSTDERPSQKVEIARESSWSNVREWTTSGGGSFLGVGGKRSAPITLQAGRLYYMEALYKEGGGGDNCAVAVQLPSEANPPVNGSGSIQGLLLGSVAPAGAVGAITINQQPASQSVNENTVVTFSVNASTAPIEGTQVPICYQWSSNGIAIPGATGPSLTFGPVSLADDGAVFAVNLATIGASLNSADAVLRVSLDTNAPTCVSATSPCNLFNVVVRYSEFMEQGAIEDHFNYSISGGLSVTGAVLNADRMSATLVLDAAMNPATSYQVTTLNVTDLAGNAIVPNPCVVTFRTPEISQQPSNQVFIALPDTLLDENFNASDGGFVAETSGAFAGTPGPWRYEAATGSWRADGHAPELNEPMTSFLTTPAVTVTRTGPVTLSFEHRYSFEFDGTRWDGGQVQISVNGSPFAAVPDAAFTQNGYGGNTVASGSRSTLANQPAFTAESTGYDAGTFITSRATATFNAGDTIRIRFVYGGDTNTRADVPNWQIDRVILALGSGAQPVAFSVGLSDCASGATYQWYRDAGAGFVAIPGATSSSYSFLPTCPDNGAQYRVQINITGGSLTSDTATLTVTAPNTPPSFTLTPPPAGPGACQPQAQTVPDTARDIAPGTATIALSRPSIGLNFGADEFPNSPNAGTLAPSTQAGVVPQVNWNNLNGANGSAAGLVANYTGTAIGTLASVTWSSPNTWSTTGRGEENNGFPAGGDRTLMTGYLDTTDQEAGAATVTVSGLGPEFTSGGYDVIVYALGGVAARGGAYSIGSTTNFGTGPANPTVHVQDAGVDHTDTGTYMRFTGLSGSSFTLIANAAEGLGFGTTRRAPINGVQIVASQGSQVPAFTFSSTFDNANGLQLGTQAGAVNVVEEGVLKLTTPINSSYGSAAITIPDRTYQSLQVSWKSRIGGGAGGGADGYSFNIGADLPADPGYGGEEGIGTGLIVAVDTFDNADIEVPDVGVEINWRGNASANRVAFIPIPKDDDGSGNFLRKDQFVNASLTVNGNGLATVTYDGNTVNAQLPGYTGLRATRALLWARTGGANDNHWIDDLSIAAFTPQSCGDESGQTVQFLVSNDNPSLFSAQPAISANGTLTYTPAANRCGAAQVTVVAMDNGGTANGGRDTSAPQTFTLTVSGCPPGDPIITCPQPIVAECAGGSTPVTYNVTAVDSCGGAALVTCVPPSGSGFSLGISNVVCTATSGAGQSASCTFTVTVRDTTPPVVTCPANITTAATSPAGAVVTYVASAADPCGLASLDCTPPPGSTFPNGVTTVTCRATNTSGIANSCQFTVTVTTGNEPPVCVLRLVPTECVLTFANVNAASVIAIDEAIGCVTLDGSGSSDPDGNPLTFRWIIDGTNVLTGAIVTNCFELGCHTVVLEVSDGLATTRCETNVCAIAASEAVEQCALLVDNTPIDRKNKRPFIASLKAAGASFDRGDFGAGINQLEAFQNKVRAQVRRSDPAAAQAFIDCAQRIIDALDCIASHDQP